MSLEARILDAHADIQAIAAWLDGLDGPTRLALVRAVGPAAQRRLWSLARGRALTLDDLVPADRGPLETVRHFGRNTLPAFRLFEKRFCRPPANMDVGMAWGYNEGHTRALIGPGYFVARPTPGDSRGAFVVDYYQVPTAKPADWPTLKHNKQGLQRFVFAEMHDFMRKVSRHVSIGRAYKRDRETPNCFLLCRED